VIAYRGAIYAIGGFNGTSRLNTGERYHPAMNTWRPIVDMFHPRSNFAIEVTPSFSEHNENERTNERTLVRLGTRRSAVHNRRIQWIDDGRQRGMLRRQYRSMVRDVHNLRHAHEQTLLVLCSSRYDIADMNLFRSALSACIVSGLTHLNLIKAVI
jgi:hypothetical protein